MQDIYAGYTGALFGVGLMDQALDYSTFSTSLAADPRGMMQELFIRQLF